LKKVRKQGISIAKLAKDMKNLGKIQTIITPGPRVPKQEGRRNGKNKL
ncbi:unnamed protein product, partial [marine sediment metagenome]